MRRFIALLGQLCLLGLLASCGGGGGGDAGGASGSGGGAALSFTPTRLASNFQSTVSTTLTVHARLTNPSAFSGTIYVFVEDEAEVLAPTFNLSVVDDVTFAATLYTSPSLAPGRYQGRFNIYLCRDSGCNAQFPGSPVPLSYDFTVANAPLRAVPARPTEATVYRGGGVTEPVGVDVSASTDWTVSSSAAWLEVSTSTGSGNQRVTATYRPQGLPLGRYSATISVLASDQQRVDLPFGVEVLPNQFTLSSRGASFSMVNGSAVAPQDVSFAMANELPAAWTAATTEPWLRADPLNGTTPSRISVWPEPSRGPLASGAHSANLVLSSPGVADRSVATLLTLIPPTLAATTHGVTLGGPRGRDLTTAEPVTLSLNTGGVSHPWALTGVPAWLAPSASAGLIDQAGGTLSLSVDRGRVLAGSVSSTVTVSATVNGDTAVRPITVNLNADQRRLLPSRWGVGLASTPIGSVLSHTLRIGANFGGPLVWAASSDSPWLHVTASGSTDGAPSLTMTADASGLPNDVLSYATVTVSTATPGVEPATVRIGLWKGRNGLASMTRLARSYWRVVGDPIRPYVYAHNGGGAIDVFNAHTAQQIGTIPGVGSTLGSMAVSPDGARLYALDQSNSTLAVVDLSTLTRVETVAMGVGAGDDTPLLVARPNGVEVVLSGNGRAYVRGQGPSNVAVNTGYPGGMLAASGDGLKVYSHNVGVGPSTITAFDLDHTAIAGGTLLSSVLGSARYVNEMQYGQDVAVSLDGGTVLIAGNTSTCIRVHPVNLSFISALPDSYGRSTNVEFLQDGRMLCSTVLGPTLYDDLLVYSASGSLLRSYRVAGVDRSIRGGQLVGTPDGLIVIGSTSDPSLVFVPIGL